MFMLWHRWLEAMRQRYRGRWALVMECFALRHQIAVMQRSRTRRPYFQPADRLVWVLLSRCWPAWRGSLLIAQPETVLRWRRQGFRSIFRQRSAGRWRGGRPRVAPGTPRPDLSHEPGELPLGCAAHSRRATEARFHRLPIDGIPYFAKPTSKAISKLDHLPAQSTGRDGNGKP